VTCARCGLELREDPRLGLVGPDGRAACLVTAQRYARPRHYRPRVAWGRSQLGLEPSVRFLLMK